jgi:hypothetical protein
MSSYISCLLRARSRSAIAAEPTLAAIRNVIGGTRAVTTSVRCNPLGSTERSVMEAALTPERACWRLKTNGGRRCEMRRSPPVRESDDSRWNRSMRPAPGRDLTWLATNGRAGGR